MTHTIDETQTTTKQAIIAYTTGEDTIEQFRFVLRSNGTGCLYDLAYNDQVEILYHELDITKFEHVLILTDVVDDPTFRTEKTIDNEVSAEEDDLLFDLVNDLFENFNEALENPVGEAPGDSELTVTNGTEEDMIKCLVAVSYLANMHGFEDFFEFTTATHEKYNEQKISDWFTVDPRITDIILAVLKAFDPRATSYEYVDQNDGRVTAYAACGDHYEIGPGSILNTVEEYFPSARERLECRTWLRDKVVEMSIDSKIIDATFPMLQS